MKIAVIFGSNSPDHDLSVKTALANVIAPLSHSEKYQIIPIYISRSGEWFSSDEFKKVSSFEGQNIDKILAKLKPLNFIITSRGLQLVVSSSKFKQDLVEEIDVVFPVLFGRNGEDGSISGFLNMCNLPYVGCDLESSVLIKSKFIAKEIVRAAGINVATAISFSKDEYIKDAELMLQRATKLKLPLFVKPVHLGNNLGITKINRASDLKSAIDKVLKIDNSVIIEETIANAVELIVPVIGNSVHSLQVGHVQKRKSPSFLNTDNITTDFLASSLTDLYEIPAVLPKDVIIKAEQIATKVYSTLGCKGHASVELLLNSTTGLLYFNEIDATPLGLNAQNWFHKGFSAQGLCEKLLSLAKDEHISRDRLSKN